LLAQKTVRVWAWLLWPWAAFASSRLERRWDVQAQCWKQDGRHTQKVSGLSVQTSAHIAPQIGCVWLRAQAGGLQTLFHATHSFQRADLGVPAWECMLAAP
jgi:hypothetical protein